MLFRSISYALTAAFGGLISILQGFDLGGLVVYLNYSKQVGQPLNQISQQMTALLSAMAGAERIFEVMDTAPEVDQGVITLVPAEKNANGELSVYSGGGRPRTWAWKVPKTCGLDLAEHPEGGWAWKYPDPDGETGLHPIRGAEIGRAPSELQSQR